MRLVFLAAWLVVASAGWARAEVASARLAITADFQLGEAEEMPVAGPPRGWGAERVDYREHHAAEWQVFLQGRDEQDGALFEEVKSADFVARFAIDRGVTLHWSEGSHSLPSDYRPFAEPLEVGRPRVLESFGGRSSDGVMPYFNLAADGGGLIVAVGWAGDWRTTFTALPGGGVRIEMGLKRSRFRLRPAERVRLPSLLVMAYRGDWLDGQNAFRRLMRDRFTPAGQPELSLMPVAASVHGMIGFNDTTEQNLIDLAGDLAELKLPVDTFWLDAGWNAGGFPAMQGNPDADPERFPRGLAPVGQAARQGGYRFLAWFEPERAMRGTWLYREHPEWLLHPSDTSEPLRYMERDGFALLDLGNRQALDWAIDSVSQHLREAGIAIYRHDFNLYPAYCWRTAEPPDEVGLREVRYVNGLYAFFDELTRRHPGLIIDNCAAGGRRLDFEMMRRSVVLWRSDSTWGEEAFPRNVQAMTLGLSHWLPLHGLGANAADEISLRSGMGVCASYAVNYRNPADVEALRRHLGRFLPVRRLFAADFYPLTPWSDRPDEWLAFQFHDSSLGEGIVQAFRGAVSASGGLLLRLRGLDPRSRYLVTNWDDAATPFERSGAELGDSGIQVGGADGGEQAIVLHYRLQEPSGSPSP